jgi:hypothetical protein
MARGSGGAQPSEKKIPTYTVVRVQGNTLTVVQPRETAKNQEAAMDAVVDRLPRDDELRNAELGAFLASSLKTKKFTSQQIVETKGELTTPSFFTAAE